MIELDPSFLHEGVSVEGQSQPTNDSVLEAGDPQDLNGQT